MNFQIGDKAVYPGRGIVEIAGVERREVDGESLSFYVLRALITEDKVLVPTEHADARGLRALCDSRGARTLLALLDEPGSLSPKESPNRRLRSLKERLDSGLAHDTASAYRDLQRLRAQKTLSFGEVRMLETARQRLAIELAHALARSFDEVVGELESHFATAA